MNLALGLALLLPGFPGFAAAMEDVPKTSANKGLHARLLVRLGGADGERAESALKSELEISPDDGELPVSLHSGVVPSGDGTSIYFRKDTWKQSS